MVIYTSSLHLTGDRVYPSDDLSDKPLVLVISVYGGEHVARTVGPLVDPIEHYKMDMTKTSGLSESLVWLFEHVLLLIQTCF